MKFKLWISPEARGFIKDKYASVNLKSKEVSSRIYSIPKEGVEISFRVEGHEDACFNIMCSKKSAYQLFRSLQETLHA